MEEIREAIGIDKVCMDGHVLFIEEQHGANANFVLQAITSHCRNNNVITCFVLFHNTFGHFHNVGMKFGYNLRKCHGSSVKVVEPLKIISKNIGRENNDASNTLDFSKPLEFDIKSRTDELVKKLVKVIKENCVLIKKEMPSQKVFLILDDLSHLFDLGLNIQDVWLFIRYLRSFVNVEPRLTLCIASHTNKVDQEAYPPNLVATGLEYFSDLVIHVQPLETGYSKSVSGKMIISWKSQEERLKFKWPEEIMYLYKLYDRQVKLFAPGSSSIM
ncbi:uncharacterized protein LOC106643019 [Copidosoma floridanum]|uniref:uncharacterized protein LOC106643019 n=1 Tax=Copidosoma floridanum TaxID=29053 RepID=UPI0006C966E5|nr:uncharacterized protein LOC106643019 [Copidosoma floridanum]